VQVTRRKEEKKKRKQGMKQQTSRKTGCGTLFGNDLHWAFFSLPSSLVELLLVFG
jgi:hypothetical protein